ncbi:hypothetical protein Daus18300_014382 [Diaporthe australafricana]|uniref:Protein kinase domain-containing protein n=1 Tax=Diaporthe australafricana TaxID=127596 RepID=A0ABR3VVG8_9PEZI
MQSSLHVDRTCIGALRERIEGSLVTSISQHRFLPTDKLHEILTRPSVHDAVQELTCGPDERIKLVDTIYNDGKRVFAMLIHNNWEDRIIDFRKHGALDNQFPLSKEHAEEIVGRQIGSRLALEFQWTFLPFTIPKQMWESQLQIDRPRILPFVSAKQIGSGAFSDVEKIGISPSQQNFTHNGSAEVQVVRKRLKVRDCMDEFNREERCLRLLNHLRHQNIIPLWGSYTYGDEHSFLFPYFDTDLGKLMMSEDRHKEFQWDFTFYSALTGLASALSNTHHLHLNETEHGIDFEGIGYHHDLRPPNILVSHDTFILADFGQGNLKDRADPSHTPYKIIGGDYIAPECTDMEERPQPVDRSIDVWAFGCLIVEVATYMLKSVDGVLEFRKKRLTPGRFPQFKDAGFYQPHGDVKQEVLDWIKKLGQDSSLASPASLLLELSVQALRKDPQERPTMDQLHQRLAFLSLQTHFDSVSDNFREICGAGGPYVPAENHHLESLRLAQQRFETWGQILGLDDHGIPTNDYVPMKRCVEVVRNLFFETQEAPDKRAFGDLSILNSIQHDMDQSIKELWDSLPASLVPSANDNLHQRGLFETWDAPTTATSGALQSSSVQHSPGTSTKPTSHPSTSVKTAINATQDFTGDNSDASSTYSDGTVLPLRKGRNQYEAKLAEDLLEYLFSISKDKSLSKRRPMHFRSIFNDSQESSVRSILGRHIGKS